MTTAFLTYRDVAERWGVTVRTVESWKAKGLITATRMGRTIRFAISDIERAERRKK